MNIAMALYEELDSVYNKFKTEMSDSMVESIANTLCEYEKKKKQVIDSVQGARMVKSRCIEKGIKEEDADSLLSSTLDIAERFGGDFESLCFIVLDSISGESVMTKKQVTHQLRVAIENCGLATMQEVGL